jgi:NADH-quinone oxidoreductase subunit A
VFLAFDVETIFLFPWAVKFKSLGVFAFTEMIIFIFILVIGLWYAWKEGALEWY